MLAAATARDPIGDVVSEVRRRVQTDDVTVTAIVTLLEAGENWAPIRREVFDWASRAHPEFGPSVVSMWLQAHPDLHRPEIDGDHRGPSHTPVFAARFRVGQVCGPWATAGSKKRAEQDAAWGLTMAVAAGESHPEVGSPLRDDPQPVPPSTTHAGVRARPASARSGPMDLDSGQASRRRERAQKDPIAWVISHAEHHGHPSPQWAVRMRAPPTRRFSPAKSATWSTQQPAAGQQRISQEPPRQRTLSIRYLTDVSSPITPVNRSSPTRSASVSIKTLWAPPWPRAGRVLDASAASGPPASERGALVVGPGCHRDRRARCAA